MTDRPVPTAIHRTDEAITITWEEGHVGIYPARDVRLACPCAACKEEMTGRALLDPATLPKDIVPLKVELVGAYAIKIAWSDGHDTGIYTYENLLAMCPCGKCAEGRTDRKE